MKSIFLLGDKAHLADWPIIIAQWHSLGYKVLYDPYIPFTLPIVITGNYNGYRSVNEANRRFCCDSIDSSEAIYLYCPNGLVNSSNVNYYLARALKTGKLTLFSHTPSVKSVVAYKLYAQLTKNRSLEKASQVYQGISYICAKPLAAKSC